MLDRPTHAIAKETRFQINQRGITLRMSAVFAIFRTNADAAGMVCSAGARTENESVFFSSSILLTNHSFIFMHVSLAKVPPTKVWCWF